VVRFYSFDENHNLKYEYYCNICGKEITKGLSEFLGGGNTKEATFMYVDYESLHFHTKCIVPLISKYFPKVIKTKHGYIKKLVSTDDKQIVIADFSDAILKKYDLEKISKEEVLEELKEDT